jgi:hypothetical protein
MNAVLKARVRKILEAVDASFGGDDEDCVINQQRELLVALGSAQMTETVRAGRAFYTGTTSALAAVVAIPTTANMLSIVNMDADGGRTLVIDWVAAQCVASTAVAGQAQMIGLVGQVRDTTPQADAALVIKKANGLGGGTNDTKARTATAVLSAANGLAANWFPIGASGVKVGVAATPGYGMWADVNGRFMVPPGRVFALHVLANVVGETFVGFIGWHEKTITLA